MVRLVFLLSLLPLVVGSCRSGSPSHQQTQTTSEVVDQPDESPPAKLRLVVVVVVDQLASWSFDPILPKLEGGFARLVAEGRYYPEVELPYANTFTAVGHSVIATGKPPSETGIMANSWHPPGQASPIESTDDPNYPILGPSPVTGAGESSQHLRVPGIADIVEGASNGAARTVAVSLKDRSAILMLGKRPDLAIWWDRNQAMMTTSQFYAESLPQWLDPQSGVLADPKRLFNHTWQPSDPGLVAEIAGGPDDGPGEGSSRGFQTTFPHQPGKLSNPAHAIVDTIMGNQLLFETVTAALDGEKLGADDTVDILAISVSSHDYAGHAWGQSSWERADHLLDIDRRLASLFADLDRRVGKDGWALVLTSDHGGLPAYDAKNPGDHPAIVKDDVAVVANQAMSKVLGKGVWVHGFSANMVHFSEAFGRRMPAERERAIVAARKAILAIPGMGMVERTDDLIGDCDKKQTEMARRVCRSLPPEMVGNLYALPTHGSRYVGSALFGSTHGTDSDQERLVPVFVRGPGYEPGRAEGEATLLQIADTVLALWGVETTSNPLPGK